MYDPQTATFSDDGNPHDDPKPLTGIPGNHEIHHWENEGGSAISLELVDRFEQVQGD